MKDWIAKQVTGFTVSDIEILLARMRFLEARVDSLQMEKDRLESQQLANLKLIADLQAHIENLKRKKDSVFSQENIENFVGGIR